MRAKECRRQHAQRDLEHHRHNAHQITSAHTRVHAHSLPACTEKVVLALLLLLVAATAEDKGTDASGTEEPPRVRIVSPVHGAVLREHHVSVHAEVHFALPSCVTHVRLRA
jgi:hypothetical protein